MKILQALLVLWIHLRLIQSAGVKADLEHPNVTLTKVAFGSCHKSKYPSSEQWRRIREEKAQAWLWLGDAVYPPMRNIAPVESLQEQYRSLKENPDYAALLASTPFVYGTWDDHDYGGNDMGKRMPDKREKRDAFLEFVGGPSLVDREGVYHSVSFGSPPHQVKIILIDTRYHRDDHCLPSVATQFALGAGIACATRWLAAGLLPTFCGTGGSMLGEEQWSWLEREISDSSAAVHIVASSVQVLSTNPVMEGWCHFPSERERFLRLLGRNPGTLLLSGDVHYAEILNPVQDLYEVTSSGITHACTKHIYGPLCKPLLDTFHSHRSDKEAYFIGRNYGSLTINWESKTLDVTIHDGLSGEAVLQTGSLEFAKLGRLTEEDLQRVPVCMDGHLIPVASAIGLGFCILVLSWRLSSRSRSEQP